MVEEFSFHSCQGDLKYDRNHSTLKLKYDWNHSLLYHFLKMFFNIICFLCFLNQINIKIIDLWYYFFKNISASIFEAVGWILINYFTHFYRAFFCVSVHETLVWIFFMNVSILQFVHLTVWNRQRQERFTLNVLRYLILSFTVFSLKPPFIPMDSISTRIILDPIQLTII